MHPLAQFNCSKLSLRLALLVNVRPTLDCSRSENEHPCNTIEDDFVSQTHYIDI